MSDASGQKTGRWRRPLFGCLLGCAFVLAAPLCFGLVFMLLYGYPPGDYVPREVEAKKMSGFSFELNDPATYWGEYSALVKVDHSRFDAIMINAIPDHLLGSVVLGMRGGKTVCFFIESGTFSEIIINGKTFEWSHGEDLPPAEELVRGVAAQLTDAEIADLQELSRLMRDRSVRKQISERTGSRRRIDFWTGCAISGFRSQVAALATMKQKIHYDEAGAALYLAEISIRQKRYEDALRYCNMAVLSTTGTTPYAHEVTGRVLLILGRYGEAKEHLLRGLAQGQRKSATLHVYLSVCLGGLGDYKAALTELGTAWHISKQETLRTLWSYLCCRATRQWILTLGSPQTAPGGP